MGITGILDHINRLIPSCVHLVILAAAGFSLRLRRRDAWAAGPGPLPLSSFPQLGQGPGREVQVGVQLQGLLQDKGRFLLQPQL
jgi:hypothetical protein